MKKTVLTEPLSRKRVWPDKCYCTGVHVAPIVEMLNAPPGVTRTASLAPGSDQPPQTFKESLLAASRTSSDAGSVHEDGPRTGRRQNPASDDMKSPHATLHSGAVVLPAPPQQAVQQQALPAQQLPVIDSAPVVPPQLPPAGAGASPKAVTVAVGPTPDNAVPQYPSIGSNIVQPAVVKADNIPSIHVHKQGDPPQGASTLPSVGYESQAATNLSTTVLNPASNTVPGDAAGSAPSVAPGAGAASSPIALSISSAVQPPQPEAAPTLVPVTFAGPGSDTVTKAVPDATPRVAPIEVPDVVEHPALPLTAGASLDATTVPISHGAVSGSTKQDVAQKSSAVSADQANPPAPRPSADGLATLPSLPGVTADQLAALIQPSEALPGTAPAHILSMSPVVPGKPSDGAVIDRKDGAGNSINGVTGLRPPGQAESAPAPSQPVSQDSSTSGDQSQGSAAQQGQNAATAQLNVPNHTIAAVDHSQNPGTAVLTPAAPVLAGVSDHAAKTPQTAAPPPIVVPQPVPVINTAKLIQSMGQSEMRVGMRSTDFGNISISTSATRDLISAQISLDHGELARTLATHLPEMQAKFGGNQAMNVRIDMNGQQSTGQSAGASAGMSNGSPDQSRSDRQQQGSGTTRQSGDAFAGQLNSIPAAVLPAAESRLDVRLDIRV